MIKTMNKRSLICLILAAGKGTRMKSALPKVLHAVAGMPMLGHVMAAARSLGVAQIRVVVSPGQDAVRDYVSEQGTIAVQPVPQGTGDAVKCGLSGVDLKNTDVLVLYGDVPLVEVATLEKLIARQLSDDKIHATILGMRPTVPTGYGRLLINTNDFVTGIVEELDATPEQRLINLCNSGMMILRGEGLMDRLGRITNNNAKNEFYLTDLISIIGQDGAFCAYVEGPADDLDGVNDRAQLAKAESRLQNKLRQKHMLNGVTLIDPSSVYFSIDAQIGNDVTIEPNVVIGTGTRISSGVEIKSFSCIEGVAIDEGARIGPFVRIRPGTTIGAGSKVNNFVELKQTHLGQHVDVSQLCCVVDSDVGDNVNIGAGTITSNYNGKDKFRTQIGDRTFVGSNSTLIAPVKIGDDAFITAGSTITENVPENMVAFGRARQVNRDHTEKTILFSNKKKGKK
jgi:bifunctional UDP-N-acetylglucosamine pyrophosphorylase / glucosamine-1-phosphate N-acetyltransferase